MISHVHSDRVFQDHDILGRSSLRDEKLRTGEVYNGLGGFEVVVPEHHVPHGLALALSMLLRHHHHMLLQAVHWLEHTVTESQEVVGHGGPNL